MGLSKSSLEVIDVPSKLPSDISVFANILNSELQLKVVLDDFVDFFLVPLFDIGDHFVVLELQRFHLGFEQLGDPFVFKVVFAHFF